MWRAIILIICGLILSPTGTGQGLTIAPILIEAQKHGGPNSLIIGSQLDRSLTVQVRAFRWDQINGQDELSPDPQLKLTPEIFRLEPGSQQTVRMMVPDTGGLGAWRIIVDELPSPQLPQQAKEPAQLNIRIRYVLPMFSYPAGDISDLQMAKQNGHADLLNKGDGYLRLGNLALETAFGNTLPLSPSIAYVLPGAKHRIRLDESTSPIRQIAFTLNNATHHLDLADRQ